MKKDITYACLFLLLLVIIFFSDAIFGGKVLAPLDILYKLLPWSSQAASDFQQSANPLLYDQVVAFYSWNTLIVEELKNKTLPLWNPYSFCGAPLLACGQTAVFYPLTVLHYMLKPEHSYLMIAIIKLMIAGFSTYLFLRQIYIPPLSALFGGVSFMFSGSIIATLGFPYTNASIFLPLLFFFSERMIKEANMKNFAPFSIIVGVQFLGGQPETSVCVLIALTVYFVLRIGRDYRTHDFRKRLVRKTSFYLGGLVSGFVLSAIQTLPFLEYLRLSAAYSFRSEYSSSAGPWYEVIVFFVPNFFGNPTHHNSWDIANMVSHCCYVGVIPLLLAIFAALHFKRIDQTLPFLGVFVFSMGAMSGLPGFNLLWKLPVIKSIIAVKFLPASVFALCVLGSMGMDFLITRDFKAKKVIVILSMISLVFICFVLFFRLYFSINIRTLQLQFYEIKNISYFLLILLFGLFFLFLLLQNKLSPQLFSLLCILLTVLDLFLFGRSFNPAIDKRALKLKPESVQFLEADRSLFRIMGTNVLMPNTSILYGLQDARGYDAMTPQRFFNYVALIDPDLPNFYKALDIENIKKNNAVNSYTLFNESVKKMLQTYGKDFEDSLKRMYYWNSNFSQIANPKLLDLMNVKYLLLPKEGDIPKPETYKLVYDKEIKIFENPNYLPRAFLVQDYEVVNDEEKVLQILQSNDFDPRKRAVLSGYNGNDSRRQEVYKDKPNRGRVAITDYKADKVVLETEVDGPAALILADAFYPGWQAYVDGQPKEIFVADYLFRGILLESGGHKVELRYAPLSFRIGSLLSGASLALLILLFLKRQAPPPKSIPGQT